jgi:hypothetical protein
MYHEVHHLAHKSLYLDPTRSYMNFETQYKIHYYCPPIYSAFKQGGNGSNSAQQTQHFSQMAVPQGQGGLVTPSGTGFPFCRLLRLAGIWWRYWTPPPHGIDERMFHQVLSIWYDAGSMQNIASNSSIIACGSLLRGTCLLSCCLATARELVYRATA